MKPKPPPQSDSQVAPFDPTAPPPDNPFDEDPFSFDAEPDAPKSPETASEGEGDSEPPDLFGGHEEGAPGLEEAKLARKNRKLARSLIDKAARAVCDLDAVKPNRAKRDALVKLLQKAGGMLW